jgi:hypothetical protein
MKKGLMVFLVLSLLLVAGAYAYNCVDGFSPSPCVCGHKANSSMGYGQVIIGGITVSCDNTGDGLCPEDYMDPSTGKVASCMSCSDPDCTATVTGHVYDSLNRPVDKTLVTSHPIRWDPSVNLESSASPTDAGGYYSLVALTGKYFFSASRDTYDTQMVEATIIRGQDATLDFNLVNGTCHADCTNSYGRINSACNGLVFDNGRKCILYNGTLVNDGGTTIFSGSIGPLCNNRLFRTEVFLGQKNDTHAYFIKCGSGTSPYIKYYAMAYTDTTSVKNLIKVEKIAKYNDVPVRLIVAYWQ